MLAPGQAVRIFTGAPVPAGADLVVMQEEAAREGDRLQITAPRGNAHIRKRGNDFAEGDRVPAGRRLGAADHQHHPGRACHAVPRGGDAAGLPVAVGAHGIARRDLAG